MQGANRYVGIAEGQTVNASHLSEFGCYDPDKARKIIFGDFRWALPDAPNTFAVLETRVRQASQFAERLWESMTDLGDVATWYPLFMPIYFDKSHFIAPRAGWKPEEKELAVKKRAAEEWCVCTGCGQIRAASFGGESTVGTVCKDCKTGIYAAYLLQDGQMRWLWEQRINAEKMGEKALVETQQSLATNPQEAFQSITPNVFSKAAREWVSQSVRPEQARGFLAADGVFHAPQRRLDSKDEVQEVPMCRAPGCKQDHSGDPERYLKIWQTPLKGYKYAIGVDVAAGYGGMHDYSVIWVNRIGDPPEPDVQVAMYRCNTIQRLAPGGRGELSRTLVQPRAGGGRLHQPSDHRGPPAEFLEVPKPLPLAQPGLRESSHPKMALGLE